MFSDPAHNVEQFGIEPGMIIADLGTGSGGYALAAASLAGPSGKVYAIEVQKELVNRMATIARTQARTIDVLWGDVERVGGTKLAERSIDAAIAANLLFQIEDKLSLVREIRRILKPRGKALIVDWSESFGGTGPHPDHVVTLAAARALFEQGGFSCVKTIEAGDHHWGLVCRAG